jgi:pilus assembly protein FimV
VVRVDKPVALLRLAAAAVLSLPLLAHAAGLGRMSVQSFLGQPLRAEIEIVALQPGEEASLEARLASGNAFAQAGIEFNPALSTIQFAIDKSSDGKPVIRVSTRQPVNEPFVDLLVELRWSTGLFVREYTVLLDPPGYEGLKPQPMAAAPVTTPSASPVPPVRAPAETAPKPAAVEPPAVAAAPSPPATEPKPAVAPAEEAKAPAAAPSAPVAPAAPAAPADVAAAPAGAQTYEVKKGDTLGEIALQYRPQGVTFHQMLIALQRANEDAFINNNINLVREGRILNIPDAEAAAAVDSADATRLVIAQHADFDEYRSRLGMTVAAAPAKPAAAERTAEGAVTAKPAEPKPATPKDQLTLSRAEPKKPGAPAAKAAAEDDRVAQRRALEEAQSRVKELEKNVADLKALLEIRNQQLAQLEQKAGAAAPAPAAKPAAPKPAPAEAPKPAAAPAKPAAEAPKPMAEAPKPAPEAPKPAAEAPKPAAEAAPAAAPKPAPKPRPIAPPPPEPSLIDEFLGNPLALGGLGIVVLLLAGYGAWAWQRKKKSVSKFQDSVLSTGAIAAAAGTAEAAPAGTPSVSQTSVSQSGAVGGMDTEDVDPIAEADVYMAYGRDAQAEEILKEALQKDPNRAAVLSKLLEIYANRRDPQAFEQIAVKLKGVTHGAGPDWDKAMGLGRSIDPGNGLYGGAPAMAAAAPAAMVAAAAPAAPSVDFDIGGGSSGVSAEPSLDLDLGGASAPSEEKTDFSPAGTLILDAEETKAASSGLDFDLGGGGTPAADAGGGLNFDLPGTSAASAPAPEPSPEPESGGGGLDFDLNLGADTKVAEASAPAAAPALDLSEISLDLGTPGEAPAGGGGANGDPKWQEVATKLDLAKAYEEMGDKDGARELLNEVVREGDSAQQGQAQQLLAKLA